VPSALGGSLGSSHKVTFQLEDVTAPPALQLHENVRVSYGEAASGTFIATGLG
jgi:hypothetical protein